MWCDIPLSSSLVLFFLTRLLSLPRSAISWHGQPVPGWPPCTMPFRYTHTATHTPSCVGRGECHKETSMVSTFLIGHWNSYNVAHINCSMHYKLMSAPDQVLTVKLFVRRGRGRFQDVLSSVLITSLREWNRPLLLSLSGSREPLPGDGLSSRRGPAHRHGETWGGHEGGGCKVCEWRGRVILGYERKDIWQGVMNMYHSGILNVKFPRLNAFSLGKKPPPPPSLLPQDNNPIKTSYHCQKALLSTYHFAIHT